PRRNARLIGQPGRGNVAVPDLLRKPRRVMSERDPSETTTPRRRALTFAAQELRLISSVVLLMALGLFLALPFVLSIGAVVFLPLVTAIVLTIVLSPLADRLSQAGLPNVLS